MFATSKKARARKTKSRQCGVDQIGPPGNKTAIGSGHNNNGGGARARTNAGKENNSMFLPALRRVKLRAAIRASGRPGVCFTFSMRVLSRWTVVCLVRDFMLAPYQGKQGEGLEFVFSSLLTGGRGPSGLPFCRPRFVVSFNGRDSLPTVGGWNSTDSLTVRLFSSGFLFHLFSVRALFEMKWKYGYLSFLHAWRFGCCVYGEH